MTRITIALSLLSTFVAGTAFALDPALCADDAVTEVPPFAASRDASQCLLVDPGNGDPAVPFQYETFHQRGLSRSAIDGGESTPDGDWAWVDLNASELGRCRSREWNEPCSFLIWDTHIDNYLSPFGRNDDLVTWGNERMEYLYIRDSTFANAWKCHLPGFEGPNGIGCPTGESSAHTDGLQLRGTNVDFGWTVFQNSALVNAQWSAIQWGPQSDNGAVNGTNALFQGFQFGSVQSYGEAETWIDDCYEQVGADSDTCENNRANIGMPMGEMWLVDVFGNARFSSLSLDVDKIVVVNTGCSRLGCDGTIGYNDGWPHPLQIGEGNLVPTACPNGLIARNLTNRSDGRTRRAVFCYTSLEAALADEPTDTADAGDCPREHCPHRAPPFVRLSDAGWADPPGVGGDPPIIDPDPPPPPTPDGATVASEDGGGRGADATRETTEMPLAGGCSTAASHPAISPLAPALLGVLLARRRRARRAGGDA